MKAAAEYFQNSQLGYCRVQDLPFGLEVEHIGLENLAFGRSYSQVHHRWVQTRKNVRQCGTRLQQDHSKAYLMALTAFLEAFGHLQALSWPWQIVWGLWQRNRPKRRRYNIAKRWPAKQKGQVVLICFVCLREARVDITTKARADVISFKIKIYRRCFVLICFCLH